MKSLRHFITTCLVSTFLASMAFAAGRGPVRELPAKRESRPTTTKEARPKRVMVDFANDKEDRILQTAVEKKAAASAVSIATVRSRTIVPAPEGDSAEPASAYSAAAPKPKAAVSKTLPAVRPMPIQPDESTVTDRISILNRSGRPIEIVQWPSEETSAVDRKDSESSVLMTTVSTSTPTLTVLPAGPTLKAAAETIAFLRAGYLKANYSKFDSRMKNGATSIGLGVGRNFDTAYGSFEARGAIDIFHAIDQSVSIENTRMLATRTEVAYWLSSARVKPGLSLGVGWNEYSVRSYRSITTAGSERDTAVRTHVQSQALSIIPGAALRVELGSGLMIDAQTEFLWLVGGEQADAVQGLAATFNLGWAL